MSKLKSWRSAWRWPAPARRADAGVRVGPADRGAGHEHDPDREPEFVIANGGVSVVTAILVEPAGTFVPDGTEVFFFTDLGRVDASGKTTTAWPESTSWPTPGPGRPR